MSWSSTPVNTKPARIRRGGWSSSPVVTERPTPQGGWTAITYMLAQAGLIGLSPAAMLQVLSKTSIPGFDGITPSATIDYVYHDVMAAAQLPDTLAPVSGIDTVFADGSTVISGLFPTASLGVITGANADTLNLSPNASALVIGGGNVDPFTNLAAAAQVLVLADAPASSITIAPSASADFPATAEVTTAITATGAYSYTIPYWCRYIDVVLLGAGGGGQGSGCCFVNGFGAGPGTFVNITLERGVDIPWSVVTITGTVGTGGGGGAAGAGAIPGIPGGGGNPTTAVINGVTQSAAGGPGGALGAWGADITGGGPGTDTYNGKPYVGGGNVTGSGANGSTPGGGGAAGAGGCCFGTKGGNGGRGQAWFRAYQ